MTTSFNTIIDADKLRLTVIGTIDYQQDKLTLNHVALPTTRNLADRNRPDLAEINLTPYLREDFLNFIAGLVHKKVLVETIEADVTPEQTPEALFEEDLA